MPDNPLTDLLADRERRRAKLISKRDQIGAEIAELDADLGALRRVAERNLLASEPSQSDPESEGPEHGALRSSVITALTTTPDDFTIADVMVRLEAMRPGESFDKSSVSGCLKRLATVDHLIDEIERGAGRRMTKYRRKGTAA